MRLKSLRVAALALSVAGVAWLAAGDLLQPEEQARQACDYTLEKQATEAWLAGAFDLSLVPGDETVPPLERMLADDRDVFVPDYPSGSYQAQIDAIREGT